MQNDPDIETVLDALHEALRGADFTALQSLAPQMEVALQELEAVDPETLMRLRAKADRNASVALTAGKGVRAAISRLQDVRQNSSGLVTYDENGKRPPRSGSSEMTRRL
jgi:predicted LPLAT superfamily acyltransferase